MTVDGAQPFAVDTHAHLDESVFDPDRDEVLVAARNVGVRAFVNIGYKPVRWESSCALRADHPDVAIVIGLHPSETADFDSTMERQLETAVDRLAPVAIGEMGFDFSRSAPAFATQQRAFRFQIELASALRLPIVIHQRDAAEPLMTELDRYPDVTPIVLHSFDGTPRLTDWALERKCFIGIGGLAMKPTATVLRELLSKIPVSRLLLETDSPYLSPPGLPRRNVPANIPHIAGSLAPLWGISGESLCQMTTRSAVELFNLTVVLD